MGLPVFAQNWPAFRGPFAQGVSDNQDLPTDWDVKSGRNLRWKTAIPGQGHSSPVVWGNQVFVTSVVRENPPKIALGGAGGLSLADDRTAQVWRLSCLDAANGNRASSIR